MNATDMSIRDRVDGRDTGKRRFRLRLHPCKRFDFSWTDWLFAVRVCLAPPLWARACEDLERAWSPDGDAVACVSARAAFDLFLGAAGAGWQAGDEIIFTALNIPAMPAIARRHGFRPVALDIDPLSAAWDADALDALVGPRTRAVVVAHLFGARAPLAPTLAVAARRRLTVIEDCAQAYVGPHWRGHPDADVSLFSFGPLKTATAFGGALARVRDAPTRQAIRRALRSAPAQPTAQQLRRLALYALLRMATTPVAYGAIVALAEALGAQPAQWANKATRNAPSDEVDAPPRRPSAALLALLARRVAQGAAPVARRDPAARALLAALGPDAPVPARHAKPHGYWLLPVLANAIDELRATLRREGFDAMPARLQPVVDGEHPTPGADALASALCLPFDPRMGQRELQRLGAVARRFLDQPPVPV